jgi:translation initiation factor IF-3
MEAVKVSTAARIIGVTSAQVHNLIKRGKLRLIYKGHVDLIDVQKYARDKVLRTVNIGEYEPPKKYKKGEQRQSAYGLSTRAVAIKNRRRIVI